MSDRSLGEAKPRDVRCAAYACVPRGSSIVSTTGLFGRLRIIAGEREVAADAVQHSFVRLVRLRSVRTYEDPRDGCASRPQQIRDHHRFAWQTDELLMRMQEDHLAPGIRSCVRSRLLEQLRRSSDKQRTALALHMWRPDGA